MRAGPDCSSPWFHATTWRTCESWIRPLYCGPTVISGVAAIRMGPSFNNKGYIIRHNFIHGCARSGFGEQGGAAIIDENEVGSNHIRFSNRFLDRPHKDFQQPFRVGRKGRSSSS